MGKSVTVAHWLLLTLGLVEAQAGKVLVFGGKSRNLENSFTEHIIVRPCAQLQ